MLKPKISQAIKNEIRKSFTDPQTIEKAQSLVARPHDFLKKVDCSFESFFYQRDYTYPNFNLYLKVLAEQRRVDLLPATLEKMKVRCFLLELRYKTFHRYLDLSQLHPHMWGLSCVTLAAEC